MTQSGSESSYSCVASFHTNPYTCGVARFNVSLARSLGTKVLTLGNALEKTPKKVLLSIKLQEIDNDGKKVLSEMLKKSDFRFDLFLHACENSQLEIDLLHQATKVFAASSEIASEIRKQRSDVLGLFAPGAPVTAMTGTSEISLLTFGMAHKISATGYRRLAQILSATKRTFQLEVSSALHEGTSFDESFFSVGLEISQVFAGNVVFVGFLADQEVSRRLLTTTALVAFFPNGVRENNTTVMSAMAHGCAVISNLDKESPNWMQHGKTIFDINKLEVFPDKNEINRVAQNAKIAVSKFSFEALAEIIDSE